jgi:hypothetical protein
MMENKRPPRPRIVTQKCTPAMADPLEFKRNKCTENARFSSCAINSIEVEIHVDKHLHIRQQQGDENGKRHGIEPEIVEGLVKKSLKFLINFSSMVAGFKFLNYEGQSEKPSRVVLMEEINGNILNVIVQVHFLGIDKFEVTIITAMVVDGFRVESGQYVVFINEKGAILKKWVNNRLQEICEI